MLLVNTLQKVCVCVCVCVCRLVFDVATLGTYFGTVAQVLLYGFCVSAVATTSSY